MAEEDIREDVDRRLAARTDVFRALANAYSFVHGQEAIRALAARTFGEILQDRINEIRGPHPMDLPSRLEELDAVKAAFDQVIEQLAAEDEKEG